MNETPGAPTAAADPIQGAAPCAVKLAVFEGPLDLLLHLIRLNEVEITEIPIARIAEQYLEYLGMMRELDMDVAGEYLLMAATLAWIKSRMLLPPDGLEASGEEIDPRAELIARLLDYQRFKEAAGELGERQWLGRDVFDARAQALEPTPESERELELGLFELLGAYRQVLLRAGPEGRPHEIEHESITVQERMHALMAALERAESLEFEQVFEAADGRAPSRAVLVATFLAVLELARLDALRVYQSLDASGVPRGPIHLRCAFEPGDRSWVTRIAEVM